jgi:hypothetical protein
MAVRGPPGGDSGREMLDPVETALEDGFEDGFSAFESEPLGGRGLDERGDACGEITEIRVELKKYRPFFQMVESGLPENTNHSRD